MVTRTRWMSLVIGATVASGPTFGAPAAMAEPASNAPMAMGVDGVIELSPPPEKEVISPPASEPTPPVQEQAPIGKPNGVLSARPREATSGDGERGAIERLDPRTNGMVRVVGSLAIVLGLIFIVARVLRRWGGSLGRAGSPSGVVEVLARYPIGRGQQLMILKVARRVLLLHQTGTTVATLSEIVDPDEVAGVLARVEAGSRDRVAERFQGVLERFGAEHRAIERAGGRAGRRSEEMFAGAEMVDLTRRPRARRGGAR